MDTNIAIKSTYSIASTPPNRLSIAEPGEPYTAFSAELIELLENGIGGPEKYIDLDSLYTNLARRIALKPKLPPPRRLDKYDGSQIVLARNRIGSVALEVQIKKLYQLVSQSIESLGGRIVELKSSIDDRLERLESGTKRMPDTQETQHSDNNSGVNFARTALDAAIELAQKNPDWPVEVPAADRRAALDRASAHCTLFEGAEILWVDDHPSTNRHEVRMLRSFGALVTPAVTTEEALRALQISTMEHQPFDLILSDISRDLPVPDVTAGLAMLPRLREASFHQPVIFYVGRYDPGAGVPAGAFGLTNRPDQLLQLVIDALSRVRRKV